MGDLLAIRSCADAAPVSLAAIVLPNGEGDMVAVRVKTAPTFSAGSASVLFRATEYLTNINHRQYDVTADGERFIMVRPVGDSVQAELILV